MLFALLAGSAVALWMQWDPWPVTSVFKPSGKDARFSRVSFSPDSSSLVFREISYTATSNSNTTFHVMDLNSGVRRATLEGVSDSNVWGPMFSPDGRRMFTAYDELRKAKIWNLRDGSLQSELTGSPDRFWNATFSPDSSRVLTNNPTNTLQLWDVQTGALLHSLPDPKGLDEASFSPDGTRILHKIQNTEFEVLDAATFKSVFKNTHHQRYVRTVEYSHDGKRIVTSSKDLTNGVFDAETGQLLISLTREIDYVQFARFSDDDRWILTSSFDELRIYDARNYELMFTHHAHYRTHIAGTEFSRDGRWLMIRGFDGNQHKGTVEDYVKVYRLGDWSEQYLLSTGRSADFAKYSPDQKRIVIGFGSIGTVGVDIFDASSFVRLHTVKFTTNNRYPELHLSPDGQWLLGVRSEGESLTLWHNRRPEWWWGIAWLPAFWATACFTLALAWSVRTDRRTLRKKSATKPAA